METLAKRRDWTALKAAAQQAAGMAYAPYYHGAAGAALLDSKGTIYTGCTVETAAAGLTFCAERAALAAMVLAGGRKIDAVALFTPTATPVAPCGTCRQVLSELGGSAVVLAFCKGSAVLDTSVPELLPLATGPGALS